MKFITIDTWDEKVWQKTCPIYHEAFAEKGAKPEKVIRNMFEKGICFLHAVFVGEEVIAMAITGKLRGLEALLIDYIAVLPHLRNKGIGLKMIQYIKEWARQQENLKSILIEVEAERTSENKRRIQFWEKCGFILTEYIHHYIWVPEPYQAMYNKLLAEAGLPEDGEVLFKYISKFHKSSFQMLNK